MVKMLCILWSFLNCPHKRKESLLFQIIPHYGKYKIIYIKLNNIYNLTSYKISATKTNGLIKPVWSKFLFLLFFFTFFYQQDLVPWLMSVW